jgi:hypothetical protein
MTVSLGFYCFAIAFALAQLEIQIEGPHGWAERLPTWRSQSAPVLRWAGKPITGQHVFLRVLILLFMHLPQMHSGFSLEGEAETLSLFSLLAVFWDFLWFVCNSHFGLARFRRGQVWWFQSWILGLPTCYFSGVIASLLIYLAPGLRPGAPPWQDRVGRWAVVLVVFAVPTLLTLAAASLASRRKVAVPKPSNR